MPRYTRPKLDQRITLQADEALVDKLDALTLHFSATRSEVLRRMIVDTYAAEGLDPLAKMSKSQSGKLLLKEKEREAKRNAPLPHDWPGGLPATVKSITCHPWMVRLERGRFRWSAYGMDDLRALDGLYIEPDLAPTQANLERWCALNPPPRDEDGNVV